MQDCPKLAPNAVSGHKEVVAPRSPREAKKMPQDLFFAKGLIGFTEYQHYRFVDIDNPLYAPLKLLVNVDEPSISLLLIELSELDDETLVKTEDLMDAPFDYLNHQQTIGCYLILTVRKPGAELLFTANTRAPIFIDFMHNNATQYVLNQKYDYAYPLTGFSKQIRQRRTIAQGA